MNKIIVLFLMLMILLGCGPTKELSMDDKEGYSGAWEGQLDLPNGKLTIVFHVDDDNGRLKAKMDSPNQGAMGIAMDKVTLENDTLLITSAALGMKFKGVLEGDTLVGTFSQGGSDFDLKMNKNANPVTLQRPQEPKGPFGYESEDVRFENSSAGIKLAGTLSYPSSGGPFAAAVLITGSGPQNRDEEIFGHKPFLLIADYLTKKGFAVLRYDDRGFGQSEGDAESATSRDLADDAEAAMAYLKTRSFIDSRKIGLIGHSEGGLINGMVAARNPETAFIIMLAGPGLRGDQLLLLQNRAIMEASGQDAEAVDKAVLENRRIYQLVTSEGAAARGKIAEILAEAGFDPENQEVMINAILSPWFIYFLKSDPADYLEKLNIPVLALFGEKDLQVPYEANMEAVEKALKKAGNKDFTVKAFPKMNHMFQGADKGLVEEYALIEETMSSIVLETMGDWLLQRF
ncbi:MAG: alpha/beta hydrolase [Spirochaetales bacterium]|nr:alpha/beta hydrolase [Spirochaetales bacterium]